MPRATPAPLRQAALARLRQGVPAARIACELGLPASTARRLLRRLAADPDRPGPDYGRCGRRLTPARRVLADAAADLRRAHPTWGAGLIRLHLPPEPGAALPPERAVRRWLTRAGLAPARPGRPPQADGAPRATQPHAVWQMDGCERIALADGQLVSWLRVADEFTGAALWAAVFPPDDLAAGRRRGHPRRAAGGLRPLGAAGADPRR